MFNSLLVLYGTGFRAAGAAKAFLVDPEPEAGLSEIEIDLSPPAVSAGLEGVDQINVPLSFPELFDRGPFLLRLVFENDAVGESVSANQVELFVQ